MKHVGAKLLGGNYEYYKNALRAKLNAILDSNLSYSQFGEDVLIDYHSRRLGIQKGIYIDVGACHPQYMSNTCKFYQKGWRGINIDPTPGSKKKFDRYRPMDINIEVAVADDEGERDFYVFSNNAELNTLVLSDQMKAHYDFFQLKPDKVIKVKTAPLKKICEKYLQNRKVNFLDIDAEGFDLQILKTYDWDTHLPELILIEEHAAIESFIEESKVYPYLKEKGYNLVGKAGPSYLFAVK